MSDENQATASEKREQVAKHELLASAGVVTTKMEEATGIRYTVKATGKVFEYLIPDAKAGTAATMLAVFGAKTKATNEASSHRQSVSKGDEVDGDEYDAVTDAFVNIDGGVWREPGAGGGRGPKYDNLVLAGVLVTLLGTNAKGDAAHYAGRLEQDKSYRAKVVARNDVKAAYWVEMAKRGTDAPKQDSGDLA